MKKNKAIVLLSGGIDSATTAAIALDQGCQLHALIFDYGQKHSVEIDHAKKLAKFFDIKDTVIIKIQSSIFHSALTSNDLPVPKDRFKEHDGEIPVTYVPARNIVFLSYAVAYAESIKASRIFIGANAVDYSGYPDCRPRFFEAFQEMTNIGTKAGISGRGITIETPLINMTKSEIILKGTRLGVDYSLTHSCYDPDSEGRSCGSCDSCIIRKKGFYDAGIPDPTIYRHAP